MEDWQSYLLGQMYSWGPRLVMAVVVIPIFWILIRLSHHGFSKLQQRFKLDLHLTQFLNKTARVVLLILGLITILGTLGINVTALVAGLGLTGFALGFALKDTISNMLAGVLLLLYRPFTVSDNIKVAGYEGMVTNIDLRYTELQQGNNRILLPNAKLFTDPVTICNSEPPTGK